jgi:hypothetical protein
MIQTRWPSLIVDSIGRHDYLCRAPIRVLFVIETNNPCEVLFNIIASAPGLEGPSEVNH